MIDTNEIRALLSDDDYEIYDTMVYELLDEIDRLRGEPIIKQPQIDTILSALRGEQTPPQGKTVDVSIKVAVDKEGNWYPHEDNYKFLLEPRAYYTLTATLPVPAEERVVAKVEGNINGL